MYFDGQTYNAARDRDRLGAQMERVFDAMSDHQWHTLPHLSEVTGDPEASVSARLRDLRKQRFGAHSIERKYVERGLFTYRLAEPQRQGDA